MFRQVCKKTKLQDRVVAHVFWNSTFLLCSIMFDRVTPYATFTLPFLLPLKHTIFWRSGYTLLEGRIYQSTVILAYVVCTFMKRLSVCCIPTKFFLYIFCSSVLLQVQRNHQKILRLCQHYRITSILPPWTIMWCFSWDHGLKWADIEKRDNWFDVKVERNESGDGGKRVAVEKSIFEVGNDTNQCVSTLAFLHMYYRSLLFFSWTNQSMNCATVVKVVKWAKVKTLQVKNPTIPARIYFSADTP